MSDQTAPEPTMEEILASIRRIISEDEPPPGTDEEDPRDEPEAADEPVMTAEPEETAAPPEPEAPPAPAALEREPEPEPEPEPQAAPEPAPRPAFRDEPLIGAVAERAAASAFRDLSAAATPAGKGRTLEDLAREMMQPMLRQWMDENLPRIVEAAVRDEVERISRSRVG